MLDASPLAQTGSVPLFALTDDHLALRDTARDFAAEKIAPHALAWDEAKHFPVDVMREAAALGMGGVYIREDVGGSASPGSTRRWCSRRWRPAAPPSRPSSPSTTWRRG
jgi:alkylation response protein AidB-like acyl-CoA dehydrogenase